MLNKRMGALIVLVAALLLSGCMTRRARLDEQIMPSGPNIRTVVVSEIVHDAQGRPLFDRVIADRPAKTGEHYTIVVYDGQKAVRSFDIALVPHESRDQEPCERNRQNRALTAAGMP